MADFLGMMKQAAQLQSKMQAMQEELGSVEVEGISGAGLVAVRMTAKMEVKSVKIDPSLMKAEEREVLEDLLVTAHNDARRKAELAMQEKMQALTGGLGLPPGSPSRPRNPLRRQHSVDRRSPARHPPSRGSATTRLVRLPSDSISVTTTYATYGHLTAEDARAALEKAGWDGEWYRRAYYDDGSVLGSAMNDECRIDAIAQSWSVLSGAGEATHAHQAMASVSRLLLRKGAPAAFRASTSLP